MADRLREVTEKKEGLQESVIYAENLKDSNKNERQK